MDQAMWERIKMEREELVEAIQDYGDAAVKYGMRLGMDPDLLRGYVQAVIEILPEPLFFDHFFEVLIRRRDDADIDLNRPAPANPFE